MTFHEKKRKKNITKYKIEYEGIIERNREGDKFIERL